MKKVVLTLLVFMLASNALAYDWHTTQQSGTWKDAATWSGTGYPQDRSDIASMVDGHVVTLDEKFTWTTTSTAMVRQIHVGRWNGTSTTGNATLDIQAGGLLKSSQLHIGGDTLGTGGYTGTMFIRAGGSFEANVGFNSGQTWIGDGVSATGILHVAGSLKTVQPDKVVTLAGNGARGRMNIMAYADIDLLNNNSFVTTGSGATLQFISSGDANFDVAGQVTIADGTNFVLDSNKYLAGATTFDILRSATGISIDLEAVNVSGAGTLSLNGNTLQMTVPEPMTIALLGLGGVFLRRRK